MFGQESAPPVSVDTSHTNESLILGIRGKQPSSCFCSHKIINGFNLFTEKPLDYIGENKKSTAVHKSKTADSV